MGNIAGSLGISRGWVSRQLGRIAGFNYGTQLGVIDGLSSSYDFIKSLGTAQGWINLGQGLVDLTLATSPIPTQRGYQIQSKIASSVADYVARIPEMSAVEMGHDAGFFTVKAGESVLLSKGAGSLGSLVREASGVSRAARGVTNLTKSQLKSIASFEKQIATHTQKLKDFKANPMKFDNKGFLKNAPNDAVRQKIIQGRINHLQQEINTFQNNIQKILNGQ